MVENDTLLAFLVPKLNRQVENAATDALGYILNKSERCREALNRLLQHGNFTVEPVVRVETQVIYEDGSRPDMAGYDRNNAVRLLVEAKFWATLLHGQASGYVRLFEQPGPAVLLFVAPRVRIPTLWAEITRQIREDGKDLGATDTDEDSRRAMVVDTDKSLLLVSWTRLLDSMASVAGDSGVEADIRQLRGLAQRQDAEAFLPIQPEELSPEAVRRLHGFLRVAGTAINLAARNKLIDVGQWGQWFGGRGYTFTIDGIPAWFGIDCDRWSAHGDTPFWLQIREGRAEVLPDEQRTGFGLIFPPNSRDTAFAPIRPKTGVEEAEVIDGLITQLKSIADAINTAKSAQPTQ